VKILISVNCTKNHNTFTELHDVHRKVI